MNLRPIICIFLLNKSNGRVTITPGTIRIEEMTVAGEKTKRLKIGLSFKVLPSSKKLIYNFFIFCFFNRLTFSLKYK